MIAADRGADQQPRGAGRRAARSAAAADRGTRARASRRPRRTRASCRRTAPGWRRSTRCARRSSARRSTSRSRRRAERCWTRTAWRRSTRSSSEIARMPLVKAVTGPGLIADATADVRNAPKQIDKSRGDLAAAETRAGRALASARRAPDARRAARPPTSRAACAQARGLLDQGSTMLGRRDEPHRRRRAPGARGSTAATDGARQLASGTQTLTRKAKLLSSALGEIRNRVDALIPAIVDGQSALRDAQARLNLLRVPAQTSARELAGRACRAGPRGLRQADPAVAGGAPARRSALAAVRRRAAARGHQPAQAGGFAGLDAALAQRARAGGGGGQADRRRGRQAGQFADVMQQVADGAGRLVTPGLSTVEGGPAASSRRRSGRRATASRPCSRSSTPWPAARSRCWRPAASCSTRSGARATPLLAQLQNGLGSASSRINTVRDQLATRTRARSSRCAALHTLERDSPGFFRSGYLVGRRARGRAPGDQRSASPGIVDSADGGAQGAHPRDAERRRPNDPRQDRIVDDVRTLTHRFQRATGIAAPVGGTAPELTDFERVNRTRVPLIILAICLVTYLALIPILRSVVLPAIAVALNLLTVAAAFGILTLLFVGDNPPMGGAGKLDVVTVTGIFVVTFALSIDYQVFLLTRMREEYVRTQSHTAAVEFGISKTATRRHRRGGDHGRRLRRVRAVELLADPAARHRARDRGPDRRDDRPPRAAAVDHEARRRPHVVAADVARREAAATSTPRARSSPATPTTCARRRRLARFQLQRPFERRAVAGVVGDRERQRHRAAVTQQPPDVLESLIVSVCLPATAKSLRALRSSCRPSASR